MIIKILKFFLSIIFVFLTIILAIEIYLRFILLNKAFYIYSFQQNGVYENISRGIKDLAKDSLIKEYEKSSAKAYADMTLGERQTIEEQIDTYTAFINKDSVQIVFEGNVSNILDYLNNKTTDLYLYFPIDKLGLETEISNQIKTYITNDNISVRELLIENNATDKDIQTYNNLKNTSYYLNMLLIFSGVGFTILLGIYALFGKKGRRHESIGLILSIDGVFVLVISWVFFTAQKIFSEGINYKTQYNEILSGILVPIFLKPLILILVLLGLILLFSGILIYNKKDKTSL